MINGIYSSASGMDAEMERLDVIANNLANASTRGFKKDEAVFTSFPNTLLHRINDRFDSPGLLAGSLSAGSQAAPALGIVGHGVQTHDVVTNFSDGSVTSTGRPLDLALRGAQLFTVERPDGSRAYTRAGNFTMNSEGRLTTMDGDLVLGQNGEPIRVSGEEVVIDSTGRVLVDGKEASRLQFATWDPKSFSKLGEGLYIKNEADVEAVTDSAPVQATVQQGYLEEANLSVVEEMVNMVVVMRSYEANQKAVQMQDNTLDKVINQVGRPG